ncbi:universal stress protein [Microvirga sp. STS02]|uniref:universal stress protein n=1 Tax=Hymenobacter negativus TaxID=2795026 RepID=UPI0018DC9034|nr:MULTISPECIES: universal stress protein [Bacteria]MBH8568640.1 universal stress protein [Hymenobacter negativus]MBR7208374.1 universal stress protein [Microvirga sp. STS02]
MKPAVVVLTDLSAAAGNAQAYAARLVARLHGRLVLLHVYQSLDPLRAPEELVLTTAAELAGRQKVQADLQQQVRQLPVPTEAELSFDPLATAVANAVRRHHPLLLAMGRATHSTPLERLLPHEVEPILRAAHYPLLLVPESWAEPELPQRALVAADGRAFTLPAPALALRELLLALQPTTAVGHVAHETHGPSHGDVALKSVQSAQLFGHLTNNSLYEVREETPADGILHAAAELNSQLIVMLARPHTFFGGVFHRSVTAQVLHRSPVPVLVLPTVA